LTSCNTVSQEIVWTPTDLKGNIDSAKTVTVRKGDSLLLTDTEEGQSLWIDTKAGGTPATFGGLPGDNFACKFDATGTFTITATVTKADNSTVKHYLLVKVLSVNLDGPIACEVGFQREKGVDIFGGVNADVSFSTNDSYLMDVSVKQATTYGSRLFLKTKKRGTPILLARLPGVNGPLLAMQEVDEFTLDIPALENTVFNAETGVGTTTITIKPYISDMTFMLNMFAHSTTFAGGVNSLNASTNVFTQIYDEESGEIVGKYTFDMEAPPTENLYCFALKVDQHSSHGSDASTTHSVNGTLCVFTVERLISEFGETRTMTITPSAWNRLLHPHGRKHSLTIVNCAAKINPDKYDCKDGQGIWKASINSTGVAAGKYEVKIDGTSFGEKYVVVKIESIFKMLDGGNVDGNNPIYVAVNDPLMLRAIPYPNEYIAGSAPVGEWPVGAPEWMVGGTNVAAAKGNSTLNVDTSKPGQFLITAWCGTSNKSVTVNVVDVQILTIQDLTDNRVLQAPADGAGVSETLRYDGIVLPYQAVPYMTFEWQIRNGRAGAFSAMGPAAPVTTLDHTHGTTGDFDVRLCASVGDLKFYSPARRVVVMESKFIRIESPVGTENTSGYVPHFGTVGYVGDYDPKVNGMTVQWQYKRDTANAWTNDPKGTTASYSRIEDLLGIFNQRIGVTFGTKTVYSALKYMAVVDVTLDIIELGFKKDHKIAKWPSGVVIDPADTEPVWKKTGNPNDPVCYTKNTMPSMFAKFEVKNPVSGAFNVQIQAKVAGKVIASAASVPMSGATVSAPDVAGVLAIPQSDAVKKLQPNIVWEFSFDGTHWITAGTSGPINSYFVEATPLESPLYDLALQKATGYVNGDTDISGKVCSGISTDMQSRYDPEHDVRGHPLHVYTDGRAQCSNMAALMRCLLRSVGKDATLTYTWSGSTALDVMFFRYPSGTPTAWWGPSFKATLPQKDSALANPCFTFHCVANVGGTYYDPSYGTVGLVAFTQTAKAGSNYYDSNSRNGADNPIGTLLGTLAADAAQQTGAAFPPANICYADWKTDSVYVHASITPSAIAADGISTATASAVTAPANAVVWSIIAPSRGCSIGAAGSVTSGTTGGPITVRATCPTTGDYHETPLILVKVENVTLTPASIRADGVSITRAAATVTPSGRALTWTIQGANLGCSINASTGVMTTGTTAGSIVVRATDISTGAHAQSSLTLTAP
jgi:hypothetical protein